MQLIQTHLSLNEMRVCNSSDAVWVRGFSDVYKQEFLFLGEEQTLEKTYPDRLRYTQTLSLSSSSVNGLVVSELYLLYSLSK